MGDQALSVAGPRAWNALPADIRCAPSLDSGEWTRTFKKHIYFLLPTIYNNCFNFFITQFYSLFYTPGTYILVCSADHGLV